MCGYGMLREHREKRWLMSLREVTAVSLLLAGTSMKSAMAKIGINITNVIHWYDTKNVPPYFYLCWVTNRLKHWVADLCHK